MVQPEQHPTVDKIKGAFGRPREQACELADGPEPTPWELPANCLHFDHTPSVGPKPQHRPRGTTFVV